MSTVEQFQAATENLANDTEQTALAIYARYRAGQLSDSDTAVLVAAAINRSNASAVSLADVWLAVQIEEQTGQPTPTVGVLPVDDSERLVKAATTVLSDGQMSPIGDISPETSNSRQRPIIADQSTKTENPANAVGITDGKGVTTTDTLSSDQPDRAETRLARLARSEPLEAAQQATHDAMQQQPLVEGWVRQFDANPCQLCVWWWREGRIWPKEHRMPTHKGCNCSQRIVLTDKAIKPVRAKRG